MLYNKYFNCFLVCLLFVFSAASLDASIDASRQSHIIERHWHGANQGPKTSHFAPWMTMQKLDALAMKTLHSGSVRQSRINPSILTYQYRFSSPIGKKTNGQFSYTLRVVASKQGRIITAFPV